MTMEGVVDNHKILLLYINTHTQLSIFGVVYVRYIICSGYMDQNFQRLHYSSQNETTYHKTA